MTHACITDGLHLSRAGSPQDGLTLPGPGGPWSAVKVGKEDRIPGLQTTDQKLRSEELFQAVRADWRLPWPPGSSAALSTSLQGLSPVTAVASLAS